MSISVCFRGLMFCLFRGIFSAPNRGILYCKTIVVLLMMWWLALC